MTALSHLAPFRRSPLPRWDVRIANRTGIVFERLGVSAPRRIDAIGVCLAEHPGLAYLPRIWDKLPEDPEAFECRQNPAFAALVVESAP